MKVLITFHPTAGVTAQTASTLVAAAGGTVLQQYTFAPITLADIPKESIASLSVSTLIKAVEPCNVGDVVIKSVSVTAGPGVAAPSTPVPWGIVKVRAQEMHAKGITGKTPAGAKIKVGIIDTGGDYTHPDLKITYAGGWDFVNNDADPMDDHGHGTHVWGTIAAKGGILGIAPDVEVRHYKVMNAAGSGSWDAVISAYQRCIDDGIQVTNNSYGGAAGSVAVETAMAAITAAGVVMMCAAGNSGAGTDTVGFPAKYPGAIAVGATDVNDLIAGFSSRGPKVEISAPGVAVESCARGGLYATMSGTSMACPHTVGCVALALCSGIPAAQIRNRMQIATDLGTPGRDNDFGFGLIDAVSFVTGVGPPPLIKPMVTFDGTSSSDPDGTIVDYSWSFGDGTSAKGATTVKKYLIVGMRTVTLSVTDSKGAVDSKSREINVAANKPPTPAMVITYSPVSKQIPCTVTFDASKSSDPDGTIVEFLWTFHDATTATGPIVSKTYTTVGAFTATLKLVDDFGGTWGPGGWGVGPFVVNLPPVAAAVVQPLAGAAPLTVICDGSASKDPDGTIASYSWDFGGLEVKTGVMSSFTFPTPGAYNVVLTVTDNAGLKTTKATTVTVAASDPTNSPPVANFLINGV